MSYNRSMNLDALKNKTILLLGKTRALEKEEFLSQLKHHDISCVTELNDKVSCIIEGHMLNPLEQDDMEKFHKENVAPFLHVSKLEKALCEEIDSSKLHMSLKLSSDEDRLLAFIKNQFITDELFLRLISLHDWKNENFFENDENRDVTAALINRFYADIEKNHNVQYATTGLLHLILQTEKEELIEMISHLQPIKKSLKDIEIENGTLKILQVIALHPLTSDSVIKMYIKNANEMLKAQIATRENLDAKFQELLYKEGSPLINSALANNRVLDAKIALQMLDDGVDIDVIASAVGLNQELFEKLKALYPQELALNSSLSEAMVNTLIELNDSKVLASLAKNEEISPLVYLKFYNLKSNDIYASLAQNRKLPPALFKELFEKELFYVELAGNTSTPKVILEELSAMNSDEVLTALSKNISTPVEILCQLQLDMRYDRYVKENESFGKHITQDNIGWL